LNLFYRENRIYKETSKHAAERGIGIIDVIISISIISVAFWTIAQVAVLGTRVREQAKNREAAIFYAQEGVEVMRFLRDLSWDTNISPLITGNLYYPNVSGTTWVLLASDPGLIDSRYTRSVELNKVLRDANDDIVSSGGTEDTDSREVTVTVSWGERQYQIVTYLTNFLFN